MPDYIAVTLSSAGLRRRQRVSGRDAPEARARLVAEGLFVERLAPVGTAGRWLARSGIPSRHLIQFFQQMEMLLSSGVLIADALGRLKDRYPDRRTRSVLREVHAQVAESRTRLSQALAGFPRSFPPGIVTVIEAGEEGGAAMLAERFGDLAERVAYQEANRKQVRNACAYPLLVIVMTIGLYLLLLGVVYPRLTDLLASLGGKLPPLTRGVIALSLAARRGWPAPAGFLAGAPLLVAGLRKIPATRLWLDQGFLRLPILGAIYRDLTVALICRVFSSLYRANKPAPEIVDLCAKLVSNEAFRRGLHEIREQITVGGSTVTRAFDQSGLFPPLACMAIDVGEQSGQIARAMDRVAAYFSARARERISASIAIINPALTLAVVGGAGAILISFFQAVYQIIYVTR